ncbi:uncharacterized protein STEHIDRAFT_117956 [Stereum hirsutum FP-91666 SS1]|uniref:uncharacterized protein n=1 Tax=Stereum hirsutum (strain FP-91666) TaxID=721885 RepID=UPI00044102C8|nr:uncharacterized protein STEHIDRAFT_117956 [Stereum hirsutum FP-91666 SS1]EIM90668.1 hypothetical protein STEHIDRAFT_117956 [Stereum hirsutum FP-91666 SS1]
MPDARRPYYSIAYLCAIVIECEGLEYHSYGDLPTDAKYARDRRSSESRFAFGLKPER